MKISTLIAPVIVLLFAGNALASEGEPLRWADFGWRVLNIILFVGILWYFAGKLIVNFLAKRREGIAKDLEDLEARRVIAKEDLGKIEQRIANLDAECQAIMQESRQAAEAGKAAIIAEAEHQAAQILEQARRTAENEGRAMVAEIRSVMADEIVDAAEKALTSKLDAVKHDKLINNSLTKVVFN